MKVKLQNTMGFTNRLIETTCISIYLDLLIHHFTWGQLTKRVFKDFTSVCSSTPVTRRRITSSSDPDILKANRTFIFKGLLVRNQNSSRASLETSETDKPMTRRHTPRGVLSVNKACTTSLYLRSSPDFYLKFNLY